MRVKARLGAGCVFLAAFVHGQSSPSWQCADDVSKSENDNQRVRISVGMSVGIIEKKVLPTVSDLKGMNVNSTVIIRALVDKTGVVRCVEAVQGDANLLQRSVDAAQQWRFRLFLLNGQPFIIETPIEFVFRKNKVTAR